MTDEEIAELKRKLAFYEERGDNWYEEADRLKDENLRLRAALANSKDPCVYCQLPAEEMAKCRAGFPGCARMDDITGCPEFGAMMNEYYLLENQNRVLDVLAAIINGDCNLDDAAAWMREHFPEDAKKRLK